MSDLVGNAADRFSPEQLIHCLFSEEKEESELESFHRKRKLLLGEYIEPTPKKTKTSPYFVSELAHVVSACEERLPFVFLGDEVMYYCSLGAKINHRIEFTQIEFTRIEFTRIEFTRIEFTRTEFSDDVA